MRCCARKQFASFCLQTTAAVAMVAAAAMSAGAAGPCYDYCPPCYDGAGQSDMGMAPTPAVAPDGAAGLEVTDPSGAQQPLAPSQEMNLSPQSDNFQAAASGEGSNVGHIGRADSVNRLNIFDSQAAMPVNRVWYGYQYVDQFRTNKNIAATTQQSLHRFGGELMVTCSSSISFMSQYSVVPAAERPVLGDCWTQPQFMAKQVVYQDCDVVLSGTLGVQIPVGTNDDEIRENTVRLAPGLLWYYNTTDCIFNYGGFQFGIPLASGNQVDTFDWSFGTGYWLYRSCCCCDLLQSVALQFEVFGKHVMGTTITQSPNLAGMAHFDENRDAVDMTFGASAYLCNGVQVSLGYSFPVSRGFVRKNELIATVGYYF